MTTTTRTDRPLPTTLEQLNAWLPEAPADTTVTRAAEVLTRISAELASITAQLAAVDRADRDAAAAVVDAAETGEIAKVLSTIKADERPVLERRHAVAELAWSLAHERHADAERTDTAYTAWRARCDQLTAEWSRAMAHEDEAERFTALVALTQRIG